MATVKNRMTLDDVLFDLRSRGVSMSKSMLSDLIADGTFAFGTVTRNILPNGKPSLRRNFLIFGKDYVRWANKNFPRGGVDEDKIDDLAGFVCENKKPAACDTPEDVTWQCAFEDDLLKNGDDIRAYAKSRGVRHWQIADELGIGDACFYRKLKRNLPKVERTNIRIAIDKVADKKEKGGIES